MQREMGIFSESPKSFKVDRKSPLASILKSSISNKLLQFLGNYTDDVLAEYIIVLICNGKHQIQARDDLEAFLGERSGEFVSWLWDHLLKHAHQSDSAIDSLDPKYSGVTSPSDDGADRDLTSSGSKYFQNDCNGNVDMSLTKNTCRHPSFHITIPIPSNKVELAKGSKFCKVLVAPSSGANTKKALLQRQSVIARKVGATENIHDGSLTNKPSKTGASFLIPVGREESFECLAKSKKNVRSISKGSPSQYLGFSTREMVFKNMESSIIEYPHAKQTYAANVSARSPPRADEDISCRGKKSRGSVWDRLGKPCKVNDETVDTQAVDIVEKGQEVYDKPIFSVPVRNDELCGSIKDQAHEFDKSSSDNKPGECRKLKEGKTMICELHAANNIQRKRHFGEFSSCLGSRSVSLVGRSNIDQWDKENQQDFKRLNSTSDTSDPALVPQVQDVKQRLRQIEIEMSKLRTKQLEMKQDGKPIVLSYSGVIKHSEEDMESRTVFVTNVHFAATKEDLSYHFAKCGVVLHVVILTDIWAGQPKGSAYITFANEESVDKALAFSGTSFFSRTLKVSRKTEQATVTSSPPQPAGKPPRAQYPKIYKANKPLYHSPHLQWRREPASATTIASEKPASP